MHRVVLVFVLAACACLVAACGGGLQDKARKAVGDPHATVVSTQTVRGLSGVRLAIVVMKPSTSTGLGCGVAQVSELVSQTLGVLAGAMPT